MILHLKRNWIDLVKCKAGEFDGSWPFCQFPNQTTKWLIEKILVYWGRTPLQLEELWVLQRWLTALVSSQKPGQKGNWPDSLKWPKALQSADKATANCIEEGKKGKRRRRRKDQVFCSAGWKRTISTSLIKSVPAHKAISLNGCEIKATTTLWTSLSSGGTI